MPISGQQIHDLADCTNGGDCSAAYLLTVPARLGVTSYTTVPEQQSPRHSRVMVMGPSMLRSMMPDRPALWVWMGLPLCRMIGYYGCAIKLFDLTGLAATTDICSKLVSGEP
jgi:hypothetical protein